MNRSLEQVCEFVISEYQSKESGTPYHIAYRLAWLATEHYCEELEVERPSPFFYKTFSEAFKYMAKRLQIYSRERS